MAPKIAKPKKALKALVVSIPLVLKGWKIKLTADSSKDTGKKKKNEKRGSYFYHNPRNK